MKQILFEHNTMIFCHKCEQDNNGLEQIFFQ